MEPTKAAAYDMDFLCMLGGGRKHKRAGITTNKGRGTSKARRKMAQASRRRNRGK